MRVCVWWGGTGRKIALGPAEGLSEEAMVQRRAPNPLCSQDHRVYLGRQKCVAVYVPARVGVQACACPGAVCEHTFLRASALWPFFQKDPYAVGGTAQMRVSRWAMSPVLTGLRGCQGWGRGAAQQGCPTRDHLSRRRAAGRWDRRRRQGGRSPAPGVRSVLTRHSAVATKGPGWSGRHRAWTRLPPPPMPESFACPTGAWRSPELRPPQPPSLGPLRPHPAHPSPRGHAAALPPAIEQRDEEV